MIVDGQRYLASVTAAFAETVQLRVTVRADFGTRSFVTIHGLQNFDYFHHYGYWSSDGYSESTDTIEITPRMLAALVHFARQNGWNPDTEKANQLMDLANLDAKAVFVEYNPGRGDGESR